MDSVALAMGNIVLPAKSGVPEPILIAGWLRGPVATELEAKTGQHLDMIRRLFYFND